MIDSYQNVYAGTEPGTPDFNRVYADYQSYNHVVEALEAAQEGIEACQYLYTIQTTESGPKFITDAPHDPRWFFPRLEIVK